MKKLEKGNRYTKDTILKSKTFAEYKDIFSAVLEQKRLYSMEELQKIVKKFTGKEI